MKILHYSTIMTIQSEQDNKATDSCLKSSIIETFKIYYKTPGNGEKHYSSNNLWSAVDRAKDTTRYEKFNVHSKTKQTKG